MLVRFVLSMFVVFAVVACEKAADPAPATEAVAAKAEPAAKATPTAVAADAGHVHNVACGCSLGKKCSNMVEVEGEYVPLAGDLGLGEMEFCGKSDLKAKVEGELKDGTYVATSFELVK